MIFQWYYILHWNLVMSWTVLHIFLLHLLQFCVNFFAPTVASLYSHPPPKTGSQGIENWPFAASFRLVLCLPGSNHTLAPHLILFKDSCIAPITKNSRWRDFVLLDQITNLVPWWWPRSLWWVHNVWTLEIVQNTHEYSTKLIYDNIWSSL